MRAIRIIRSIRYYFLNPALEIEIFFRLIIVLAVENFLKTFDRIFERHIFPDAASECFGYEERLREKALDFAGAVYGSAVHIRKFLDAEDRDNILKFLVALERFLHITRDVIVFAADDFRVERA